MPKRDKFLIKIGKSFNIFMIVDCRFENLYVDVDFGPIFIVDCRPMSKNIVESTERLTPPGPPPHWLSLTTCGTQQQATRLSALKAQS